MVICFYLPLNYVVNLKSTAAFGNKFFQRKQILFTEGVLILESLDIQMRELFTKLKKD